MSIFKCSNRQMYMVSFFIWRRTGRDFLVTVHGKNGIAITGVFRFRNMSANFIRDPDRNVIELDACGAPSFEDSDGYADQPWVTVQVWIR